LRLAPELVEVLVSGQECILNRVLRVGCVAQVAIGLSIKQWQAAREDSLHFPIFLFANADREARFASDVCLYRLHVVLRLLARQEKGTPLANQSHGMLAVYFQRHESTGRREMA
jgi:hypothetical protein